MKRSLATVIFGVGIGILAFQAGRHQSSLRPPDAQPAQVLAPQAADLTDFRKVVDTVDRVLIECEKLNANLSRGTSHDEFLRRLGTVDDAVIVLRSDLSKLSPQVMSDPPAFAKDSFREAMSHLEEAVACYPNALVRWTSALDKEREAESHPGASGFVESLREARDEEISIRDRLFAQAIQNTQAAREQIDKLRAEMRSQIADR